MQAQQKAPGKVFKYKGKLYKNFRGMGSVGAMSVGSADRYFQKKTKNISKYVAEGVEGHCSIQRTIRKCHSSISWWIKILYGLMLLNLQLKIYKKV